MRCLFINLDGAAARRAALEQAFREAPGGWSLERIPAIGREEASAFPGSVHLAARGCYLSHMRALERSLELPGDVMVLEDDAAFSPRSFAIIEHLVAHTSGWDLLFTDAEILDHRRMLWLARHFPEFARDGRFQLEDLSQTRFAGTSAYVVRDASKQRLLDLVRSAGLDAAYDIQLGEIIARGELAARCCFPFATTVAAEPSQISGADYTGSLEHMGRQALRRLWFVDRDLAACASMGDRLMDRQDDHARLCGIALGAIVAKPE